MKNHSHKHSHDSAPQPARRQKLKNVDEETMNREDQQHFQDIVDAFAYYG
jgi:hypothetical protein